MILRSSLLLLALGAAVAQVEEVQGVSDSVSLNFGLAAEGASLLGFHVVSFSSTPLA